MGRGSANKNKKEKKMGHQEGSLTQRAQPKFKSFYSVRSIIFHNRVIVPYNTGNKEERESRVDQSSNYSIFIKPVIHTFHIS